MRPENIKLRLPDESMTAAKRSKHRRELYNKALSLAGIVLVLGVSAGAWMYEHKIANAHEMGNRQASEALVNVEHVKSQLKSAQQERIGAWPRQAEAMQGFLFMAAHNLRFSVKGTKVNAEKMVATLHADDAHRAHIVTEESGVEHEHLIDGSVLLSWYVPKGVQ